MALKIGFRGPHCGLFDVLDDEPLFGVASLLRMLIAFSDGDILMKFVYSGFIGALASRQLTINLELVRTRGIRLFN